MKRDAEMARWRKSNPWVLVNVQNSQAFSGRYPTREAAEKAASDRGGVIEVQEASRCVLFSEMPLL